MKLGQLLAVFLQAGILCIASCQWQPRQTSAIHSITVDPATDLVAADLTGLLVDPIRPYLYVTDRAQHKLHIYSTETYEKVTSIAVELHPTRMQLNGDHSRLFIVSQTYNNTSLNKKNISVVDLTNQRLLDTFEIDGQPFLAANDLLYVPSMDDFTFKYNISVLDVSTLPPKQLSSIVLKNTSVSASIIGGSTDHNFLYFGQGPYITKWDISGQTPVELQFVNNFDTYGVSNWISNSDRIVPSPDDSTLLFRISSYSSAIPPPEYEPSLIVAKSADLSFIDIIEVDYRIKAAVYHPAGKKIAVAHYDKSTRYDDVNVFPPTPAIGHGRTPDIHIIDSTTYNEIGLYHTEGIVGGYDGLAYGPDGRLYAILGAIDEAISTPEWRIIMPSSTIGVFAP